MTIGWNQQTVRQAAREMGFHLAGIAPALQAGGPAAPGGQVAPELAYFEQWIDEGRAGEMEYLKRRGPDGELLRTSIQIAFPWVRSVIVCAANYNSDQPKSMESVAGGDVGERGWIARYAWSGQPVETSESPAETQTETLAGLTPTDYHSVIRGRLERLRETLQNRIGAFEARCFVDTGPLVERVYARYAGLGWQGKNTCLINEALGSWIFLGVMLTSLELPREKWAQPAPDRCGSCTRCIDACPTDALEPYRMDASRCIAYLTIEKRGPMPEELAGKVGRHVFGCDICQEVCPWNRRAPVTDWPELQPRPELVNPALDWLANLTQPEYRALFRNSPLERARYTGLLRNVENAMRNASSHGQASAEEDQQIAEQGIAEHPSGRAPSVA
jgi:epoxyqueuosine reductase